MFRDGAKTSLWLRYGLTITLQNSIVIEGIKTAMLQSGKSLIKTLHHALALSSTGQGIRIAKEIVPNILSVPLLNGVEL
jgi:hypothetical protein